MDFEKKTYFEHDGTKVSFETFVSEEHDDKGELTTVACINQDGIDVYLTKGELAQILDIFNSLSK